MKKKGLSVLVISLSSVLTFAGEIQQEPAAGQSDCFTYAGLGLLVTSLVFAHFAAPQTYSSHTDTISQLGAQGYDRAWITRAGFIGFGLAVDAAAVADLCSGGDSWVRAVPMLLYGSCMAMSGLFSAAPFEYGAPYSQIEAQMHSGFANTAGIAFCLGMIGHAITAKTWWGRIIDLVGAGLVIGCTFMVKTQPENCGVWQRALWGISLTWLAASRQW